MQCNSKLRPRPSSADTGFGFLCAFLAALGGPALSSLTACGSSSAVAIRDNFVSVDPSTVTLTAGATQHFTATVRNNRNQAVTWSVQEGASGGTVDSSGNYAAPAQPGTYHVIATSQVDTNKTGSATITVVSGAPPSITDFSPRSGPVKTQVAITGANFLGTTSVTFNGTPASEYTVQTDGRKVFAKVPPGATSGPIQVTNQLGTARSSDDFDVTSAPVIDNFSPTSGEVGAEVTIRGNNFGDDAVVEFSGSDQRVQAFVGFNSNTQINTIVPAGAATGPITVITKAGVAQSPTVFTVVTPTTNPTIVRFTPPQGAVGAPVTIYGSNLGNATVVKFNGTSASFTDIGPGQINTHVPTGATTGPITVTTPAGTATSATNFTVLSSPPPAPTITDFSPPGGPVGQLVTINGTNLSNATSVAFNSTPATMISDSSTQVQARVPNGATSGPISITTPGGIAVSPSSFTVQASPPPAPTITGLSTTAAPPGTSVAIYGTNFTGATNVSFNGTSASFTFISAGEIDAIVPAGATTGYITVTTPGGTATSPIQFTVQPLGPPAPGIASFTPTAGAPGTMVTIYGHDFSGATSVTFNGTPVPTALYTVQTNGEITAPVPAGATTGPIAVTTPGGTATSSSNFTIQGSLSAVRAAPPSSVDLTAEGTSDWAKWGNMAADFERKQSGGSQISNYTPIGTATAALFYPSYDVLQTWENDGTPDASGSTTGGILRGPAVPGGAVGDGFLVTAPADTTPRTFHVYVRVYSGTATVTGSLGDGSTPAFVDTTFSSAANTGTTALYAFRFNAASPGQTFSFQIMLNTDNTPPGVAVAAAAVTAGAVATTGGGAVILLAADLQVGP